MLSGREKGQGFGTYGVEEDVVLDNLLVGTLAVLGLVDVPLGDARVDQTGSLEGVDGSPTAPSEGTVETSADHTKQKPAKREKR